MRCVGLSHGKRVGDGDYSPWEGPRGSAGRRASGCAACGRSLKRFGHTPNARVHSQMMPSLSGQRRECDPPLPRARPAGCLSERGARAERAPSIDLLNSGSSFTQNLTQAISPSNSPPLSRCSGQCTTAVPSETDPVSHSPVPGNHNSQQLGQHQPHPAHKQHPYSCTPLP